MLGNSVANIGLLSYSKTAARMWCFLHSNLGMFLIGNWYRPPDDGDTSIAFLAEEMSNLRVDVVGVILAGDMNIHHRMWLRYSRENTAFGEQLLNISRENGLKHMVRAPTRGEYLLDLVLTDVSDMMQIIVLPNLADHCVVCIDMSVDIGRTEISLRDVWDFRRAAWYGLKVAFKERRWGEFLDEAHFDDSLETFCNHLCEFALRFIPKKSVLNRQNAYPWLDDKCFAALEAKCLATSRDDFCF